MERTAQWILWVALIQLLLNLSDAMLSGRKLSATTSNTHSDFISIDCGASEEYTDHQTGISYQTDTGFVDTGDNFMVAPEKRYDIYYPYFGRQLQTLRRFPEGRRNCYTLKPKQGKNQSYLIRAFFSYENYDGRNQTPSFELYLGVNYWKNIYPIKNYHFAEIIHTPMADTIHVCLVKSGKGIPFISTLELRPLNNSIYTTPSPSQSLLELQTRIDVGYVSNTTSLHIRYMDDIYDRTWRMGNTLNLTDWHVFNKSVDIDPQSTNDSYRLPARVLLSAAKSSNRSSALNFDCVSAWGGPFEYSFTYFVYFHFAEIEQLPHGQKRVIDITVNDEKFLPKPITLEYLKPQTVFTVTNQSCLRFSISATSESAAPPILNAFEVYRLISPLTLPTDQRDVDAIWDIKITYKIFKLDWQGDPCISNFAWKGLMCSSLTDHSYARITSLNLSMSQLTGHIVISFSQLLELESLDLSDNKLSGTIPEFLAKLPKLKVLNLRGNKLTGSIPNILKEKSDLEMSLDGNADLCLTDPCKKHKFAIPVIASVSILIVVILVLLGIWFFGIKRLKGDFTRRESSKLRSKAFSYSNVLEITNNLQNLIGEGGFGKVYLGSLKNDTQVAVKLLSQSSVQGHREFRSEVELLMVVHHRHLVSLIGYCEETGARALVYEYMANGDLRQHLSGNNKHALKWKNRLQIALDAARGLEYLHDGCKPAIVHRDLKTTNILLDENMEAKIADFGLSRAFANDIDSHVSTRPAGTIGYLDPDFGIILLELITGQPAAKRHPNNTVSLLLQWVTPKVKNKDIQYIVDPRFQGKYNVDSAWKFLEIAMSCTAPTAIQRPVISQVVYELRECLAMEISMEVTSSDHPINSSSSMNTSALQFDSDVSILSGR
ncbi:putative leucine-rich repeat receptor-like serine/threonine-protein kinase At2g19230 isoform X2 [Neltuma alba]|uniref:putative leucine-rich repeat receptor-like serine/threonine-protein kinase At2g19230 isoform X2 n=1 Tax=Neltuma alba TaxID=207710 RepID=UPI0010A4358A|nr:putative leucine-rich repeat receptor-like serine/threonine-protein kinase At2g19230 isoform X2 [Prosopis alba]